ncbi:MAG TPA: response regulator, partial [Verrucomicrobiae bacterium]
MTSPNNQTSSAKSVRILVVEDSPLNQQVALKQLEKLGYLADAVDEGGKAVEAHTRAPYDIILMDCQMPLMSGYEATWQIRNREQEKADAAETIKRAYIIAMTANTQADNREKCASAGMDGFISKPVQMAELEVALYRALADQATLKETESVIDPVVIAGLHQLRVPGKPDPVVGLIDLFLSEALTQLDVMSDAVAKNDLSSLSRTISAATAL